MLACFIYFTSEISVMEYTDRNFWRKVDETSFSVLLKKSELWIYAVLNNVI